MIQVVDAIVNNLNQAGICILNDYFDESYCQQAVNEINEGLTKYQDKVQSEEKEGTSGDFRLFKMENQYETAQKFATDKLFQAVATKYYGKELTTHFVLGGKVASVPDKITNSGGGWHRDSREKQIKAIVYLTDVNENSGPFLFLPHSKQFDLQTRQNKPTRYDDEVVEKFCIENNLEPFKVLAKKGTVVLVDTSYIHRGANIQEGTRYSYTNYYLENTPIRHQMTEQKWGKNFI